MKVVFLLISTLGLIAGLSCSNDIVLSSGREIALQNQDTSSNCLTVSRPAGRTLLSVQTPKQELELFAAPNGTLYLVETNLGRVRWSFSSGPPIYSSYHIPLIQEDEKDDVMGYKSYSFVDCADDWELYMTSSFGKWKLGHNIQEYVKRTPQIAEDGHITLGSTHASVFRVDPLTGKLIQNYGHSACPSVSKGDRRASSKQDSVEVEKTSYVEPQRPNLGLFITRKDYTLRYLASDSVDIWNLTVAYFDAILKCDGNDGSLEGSFSDSEDNVGSDSDSHLGSQLPRLHEFVVHRFCNQTLFDFSIMFNRLPEAERQLISQQVSKSKRLPLRSIEEKSSVIHRKLVSLSAQARLHLAESTIIDFPWSNGGNGPHLPSKLKSVSRLRMVIGRFILWSAPFVAVLFVAYVVYHYSQTTGVVVDSVGKHSSVRHASSRRKRTCKSGRSISSLEDGINMEDDNKQLLKFNDGTGGRVIGKLFVSNIELAKGSNGTVVFEGIYEGRNVAVKRLLQAHHSVATKEIQNLITSDQHPNIVRWYGVEYDKDFVYLALEHCTCTLSDLIQLHLSFPGTSVPLNNGAMNESIEDRDRICSLKAIMQDIELWKDDGYPSAVLLKLMRDVTSGLFHLHELGIIHRDIKPQNILITRGRTLCAKLSDMGISKRLCADTTSLGHQVTGYGSSGWQAPEQLLHGCQTRAVDMFSFGCVFFFCSTGGRHPFGDRFERDANIIKNKMDLFPLEHIPEAVDLLSCLLHPDPQMRPKAYEVLLHPFFWDSEKRLSFLRDVSDRVELEDREAYSYILNTLESVAPMALGGKWDEKMEPIFLNNIGRYRRYKYQSVRDLLRVMRNKLNHYRELPKEVQVVLGSVPEGFDTYFRNRFPRLLIQVYKVVYVHCKDEKCFQKYFSGGAV